MSDARTGLLKAVAAELGCRPTTAKDHVSRSYRRLGVTNAIEALTALGWLDIDDREEPR